MTHFHYARPRDLQDALSFMSDHAGKVKPLAGGTDLLVAARAAETELPWEWALDLTGLPELREIREDDGRVIIGACATHSQIAQSSVIAGAAPFLAQAVLTIGSCQIRNRATIGGNVMNASPAADSVPVLAALDAMAKLTSVRGEREIPVSQLISGAYSTCAFGDELLTEISFVPLSQDARSTFIKLGRRRALAISRLACAAAVTVNEDEIVTDARISAGAAFSRPCRIREAEKVLIGCEFDSALADKAAQAAADEMVQATGVRWSTEYKKPVLAALVSRAVTQCAEKRGGFCARVGAEKEKEDRLL